MRCFNHREVEAIGVCKACAKGLCVDCAADLGHGLACRGKHEAEVEGVNAITKRATRVQSTVVRTKLVAPAFYLVMGSLFLAWGFREGGKLDLLLYLGAAFIVYGIVASIANLRAYGKG